VSSNPLALVFTFGFFLTLSAAVIHDIMVLFIGSYLLAQSLGWAYLMREFGDE
jgi:hypothetical protein